MAKFKKGHKGYWLGKKKPISKRTKEKIRKKLIGHFVSLEVRKKISNKLKGHQAWNKGKKWSKEIKEKIRQTNKMKGIEPKIKFVGFGINHPRWKGGVNSKNHRIRGRVKYRLWREAVFIRDNWTCQKTGIRGKYLHPHHIQNFAQYPKLRFAISNGITLSKKSHRKFHEIYGTKNNTQKQLEEFLSIK